jgi:serine/threonine protein kinase
MELNQQCEVDFKKLEDVGASEKCLTLLRRLLDVRPRARPSARDALLHPWFEASRPGIEFLLDFNRKLHKDGL